MDYKKIYEEEHLKNGLTYKEIQKKYNINRGTWDFHIRYKLGLRCDKRKVRINDDFFSSIDSEIKAYLLGFFVADGCITKDGRISILLHHQDKYILELFKQYIAPDHKIIHSDYAPNERSEQVKIRFKSDKMVSDLFNLGIFKNKTYTEIDTFERIPDFLKPHFLRGFTDGDGHIGKRHKSISWCCSSKLLLDQIYTYISQFTDSKIYLKEHIGKTCNYYTLGVWTNKGTIVLCRLLYSNCNFALPRKKQVALNG